MRELSISRVHIPAVAAFSAGGFILPHQLPRPNGQSSSLPIGLLLVRITIAYRASSAEPAGKITITIDHQRRKTMTTSILHRLINLHFALLQVLLPSIEAAWGAEDGYLLVRDLGDQLRQVMSELEALDA